jgi:hypothetical protein
VSAVLIANSNAQLTRPPVWRQRVLSDAQEGVGCFVTRGLHIGKFGPFVVQRDDFPIVKIEKEPRHQELSANRNRLRRGGPPLLGDTIYYDKAGSLKDEMYVFAPTPQTKRI